MKKIKMTDELLERVGAIFKKDEVIRTGEGLSRGELRALDRAGYVQHSVGGGAGPQMCVWKAKEKLWKTISKLSLLKTVTL